MDHQFKTVMQTNADEIRKIVCNLSSIAERYFSGFIQQELAIDQIRIMVSRSALIEQISPFISSSDHFFLTQSLFMDFRKLSNEDMNELLQGVTIIFLRLLDQYEENLASEKARLSNIQVSA